MRIATFWQHENGMYHGEIQDGTGRVESAVTTMTSFSIKQWAREHGATELVLVKKGK